MNKSSPEYIRVREELAKKIFNMSIENDSNPEDLWEAIADKKKRFAQADSILAIKGIAIIADDQNLPDYPANGLDIYSPMEVDNKCRTFGGKILRANFKKVVE
jgi:hypothetical protein